MGKILLNCMGGGAGGHFESCLCFALPRVAGPFILAIPSCSNMPKSITIIQDQTKYHTSIQENQTLLSSNLFLFSIIVVEFSKHRSGEIIRLIRILLVQEFLPIFM